MECVEVALDKTVTQQLHPAQDNPARSTPRETWKGHRACVECRRHVNRAYIPLFFRSSLLFTHLDPFDSRLTRRICVGST